jgi:hypothetical protein
MRIATTEDRILFLKYALPCAGTLVKRGKTTKEHVESLVKLVSAGRAPEEDAESMFKVATTMCDSIATRIGKESVDSDVIRQYFLLEHSEVVDDRHALMRDFDPISCKTYVGSVQDARGGEATVRTILGDRRYRTDFTKTLKVGDNVVVHWNFVVEKVPDVFLKRMEGSK